MNIFARFFRPKPVPQPLPHIVFVTRKEPKKFRAARESKEIELYQFLASKGITSPEQLRSARELGASVRLGRSA